MMSNTETCEVCSRSVDPGEDLAIEDGGWLCQDCVYAFVPEAKPVVHREHPCPTEGCPGDGRYASPGRGHREGCSFPSDEQELGDKVHEQTTRRQHLEQVVLDAAIPYTLDRAEHDAHPWLSEALKVEREFQVLFDAVMDLRDFDANL